MEQTDGELSHEELERRIAIALGLPLDNVRTSLENIRIGTTGITERFNLQAFILTPNQVRDAANQIRKK